MGVQKIPPNSLNFQWWVPKSLFQKTQFDVTFIVRGGPLAATTSIVMLVITKPFWTRQ